MASEPLSARDSVEAALKLGDCAWRDFDTRRSYEWKANLALWTALGAFSFLFLKGDAKPLPGPWMAAAIVILLLIDAVYIFIWTPGVFRRNRHDQDSAHSYWHQAATLANLKIPPVPEISRSAFKNWSHASQVMITLFLTLVAILAVVRPSSSGPPAPGPSKQINFYQGH